MKYFIKSNVKTVENKQVSAPYFFDHNTNTTLTAGALKTIIKGEYNLPPSYTVKEEILKVDGEVVTNDFVVPFKSDINYTLIVIDPSVPVSPSVTPSVTPSISVSPTPSVTPVVSPTV
jgi:hypothetical protein